jgi:LSD1 subclass zinc finger protein
MKVHLLDGTYELFRNYFGAPSAKAPDGREVGATRGFCRTLLSLLTKEGATHVACAFDHVIESFRNQLFAGYKTGEGIDPELWGQAPLVERASYALGVVVWPMVEFEADDALATGAARWAEAPGVEQVLLCSPDKDLAQCVRGDRVVCLDRRRNLVLNEAGVREKFGVSPASIPDFLALVGDAADGIPGIPRWGEKASAAVLARYGTIDAIPEEASEWAVTVRGAASLAENLRKQRQEALLYRQLARLREDVPLKESLDDLAWRGARPEPLRAFCEELGDPNFFSRVSRWRDD